MSTEAKQASVGGGGLVKILLTLVLAGCAYGAKHFGLFGDDTGNAGSQTESSEDQPFKRAPSVTNPSETEAPKQATPNKPAPKQTTPPAAKREPAKKEPVKTPSRPAIDAGARRIEQAKAAKESEVWVETECIVTRKLADDLEGSRHQKFLVKISTGSTLLIPHNIDLAPRVPVSVGDKLLIRGRYEWNDRGGVLHWTHHDPRGRQKGGWIQHKGKIYK